MLLSEFQLSKHAIEQMHLRGISQAEIESVLKNPKQIIHDNDLHKTIYQGIIAQQFLLRIFIAIDKNPKLIITLYKTSKISKYLLP